MQEKLPLVAQACCVLTALASTPASSWGSPATALAGLFACSPTFRHLLHGTPGMLRPDNAAVLTPRQREVSTLLAGGATDQEIATRLGMAKSTVESHVQNILVKLDACTRLHPK